MNCNKCLYLKDNKCTIGKHQFLGPLYDSKTGEIVSLSYNCLFKNTEHGVTFKTAHQLAMTRLAVASYFIIRSDADINKLFSLCDDEWQYKEDSLIGQFNVLNNKVLIGKELKLICDRIQSYNEKRLWNYITIIDKEDLAENIHTGVPNYIIDNCRLPYFIILEDTEDFPLVHTFKYHSFSRPPVEYFGKIKSISAVRKSIEEKELAYEALA